MHGEQFISYLTARRPLIEEWIAGHAWKRAEAAPADLDGFLYAPLAHYNAGGGKRVRPVLALLGCEAVGAPAGRALASGCAIELFQSAALIHDDIADEGELRRGEPCLHLSQGLGPAINIGDGALVEASDAVLGDPALDDAARLDVLRELVAMERRTVEGQALDLCWVRDGRWDLAPEDYLAMAILKTAHYSCASPLAIGALCGGGSAEQVEALRSFGLDAGLAFQIQDDLLNLCGDPAEQGKDFMNDITEGKRTLAALYALAHLEDVPKRRFLEIVSSGTADTDALREAVALMDGAGALSYARETAQTLVARATDGLAQADIAPEARDTLVSMAHYFVERAG